MHTDNKAGIVGKTDFTNGQKLHFENVSVNVSHCVENKDDNYLMVTINHREKIFFIGQTSNVLQYAGYISRFIRSDGGKICANVPAKAIAASERGNHKYWSMEILIATKANWDCIFNTLPTAGYKNLSSRNFLPPPEEVVESEKQDTEKNVCDTIALNIGTMEQTVLLNISRKNKATRETIMELIDKHEFDIDNICEVIYAAVTKSDICNGFIARGNEITKSKIKIALIEGTPPSAAGSLAFFEIVLCILNEVISELLSSEYRSKYTDTAYIMAA